MVTWQLFDRSLYAAPGMRIAFDYLLGPEDRRLVLQVYNQTQRQNHHLQLARSGGGWQHVEVQLAELVGVVAPGRRFEPGDKLGNVVLVGGRGGIRPLYVDGLRFEQGTAP
jgi:hypothetical protein